ncbi:MAG: SGNH/GDSL hydrolase family protein [Candidatus Solibacter usitatus]|nr:SGNH/GDSL hydrolase family protein [Candidatus Solibacter usitatus]
MKMFLLVLWAALSLGAQNPDPALAPVAETPGLPRVLLIGDSISMGYTLPVRELLKGKANVLRIPVNGAFTRFALQNVDKWLGDGKWDVIHANWGLHDLKIMDDGKHQVGIEEYERNLEALMMRLKKTGARVIYATTTPVPEGKVSPPRIPADVARFNAVAVAVMRRNGIRVNDLYAAILPRLGELQRPVNVHYTAAGYDFLAVHVAKAIEQQ